MIPLAPGTTEADRYNPGTSGGADALVKKIEALTLHLELRDRQIRRLLVLLEVARSVIESGDREGQADIVERIGALMRDAESAGF